MILGMDEIGRFVGRYAATGAAIVAMVLPSGTGPGPATPPADPGRAPVATVQPTARPTADGRAGTETSPTPPDTAAAPAAGTPTRVDDFSGPLATGSNRWRLYTGPGHAGQGRRSPAAATVRAGVLTLTGDAVGTTEGMAWGMGRRYGRWEARVRTPVVDPSYHATLALWPDSERWPADGEIDFMELADSSRPVVEGFVHRGDRQLRAAVDADPTQWHTWAVDWRPSSITMSLDGHPWAHMTDRAAQPPAPMHLCLQLDWLPTGHRPVRPSTMQVDWVREYAPAPAGG